jgi:hypothetical protein
MAVKFTLTIRLKGKKFEAVFQVWDDETSQPVEGAVCVIADLQGMTDAEGIAIVGVFSKGTYTFTVEHQDYELYEGVVSTP